MVFLACPDYAPAKFNIWRQPGALNKERLRWVIAVAAMEWGRDHMLKEGNWWSLWQVPTAAH